MSIDPEQTAVVRALRLMWGLDEAPTKGPSRRHTVCEVVDAAIAIADGEGLDAMSMRRLATTLGLGTMSLYRYVPGRQELVDLMVDRVHGELDLETGHDSTWRTGLQRIAAQQLALYERHPWLATVYPGRPPMGPNVITAYERRLRSLEGTGLSDVEMDLALTSVLGMVRNHVTTRQQAAANAERTGLDDLAWWQAVAPTLEQLRVAERFPLATRVGGSATDHYGGVSDPRRTLELTLQLLLDGIDTLLARRR